MSADLRVVLDTNVVVSAMLLPHSVSRRATDYAMTHGRLLVSAATLAEVSDVIRLPRFDKYLSDDERAEFVATLVSESELIDVDVTITDCRDSRDNKFLELAVAGRATHIVTGDKDLLVLGPFRGVGIVSPGQFALLR
jgi:uncharacterized protein